MDRGLGSLTSLSASNITVTDVSRPKAQGHRVYPTEQNYFTHWNENALVYSKQAANKHKKKYVFLLKKKFKSGLEL